MGVVAETADWVIVQYAAQQMETNATRELTRREHAAARAVERARHDTRNGGESKIQGSD
jgi:ABC-type dipeptide/oligopeptide/nickel transport system ATPase component